MARQKLGQHFLADPGWREEIARAIRVSPQSLAPSTDSADKNVCWIEIGAGHGEMTEHLLSTGLPVYAIELDAALARRLDKLGKKFPNLSVLASDVLHVNLASLRAGTRLRVYGNLPYYITSPILQHLFRSADLIDEIHVVVQHEVALRLVAEPASRDYGYLTVLTRFFSRPELVLQIPRAAFDPAPDVDSALVTLRLPGDRARVKDLDEHGFLEFVKRCFSQKRKTLVNNLKAVAKAAAVRQVLESAGVRTDARAEQLSVSDFAKLFRDVSRPTN
jgi:16S rRNA (adenine1518-N6/adenine1519-N6)-dimethyltransferase